MSLGDLGIGSINGGPIGTKNVIINGNFGINQRGVSGTVTLAAGAYGHDRWKAGSGGCTYTFATVANVTTLTITAGTLIQVIEGLNLSSGTHTLSFAGTAQGKIGAGSFSGSGVTGAAVGGTNLNIEFNTGTVSLVQFELGSVATPFERRPFGAELALCQRYYQKSKARQTIGAFETSTNIQATTIFLVEMRADPTVTRLSDSTWGTSLAQVTNSSNFLFTGVSSKGCTIAFATTGLTAPVGLPATCNTSDSLEFNAEL